MPDASKPIVRPWVVRSSQIVHRDEWVCLRADHCVTHDGHDIAPYYVLEGPDTVHIVAIDDQDNVLLTRQYRHGLGVISLELPCGRMEPGETPVAAAARELLEETGYGAGRVTLVASLSPNPANHAARLHIVLAENIVAARAPALDPREVLEFELTPRQQALELALSGAVVQAIHVGALVLALRAAGKLTI